MLTLKASDFQLLRMDRAECSPTPWSWKSCEGSPLLGARLPQPTRQPGHHKAPVPGGRAALSLSAPSRAQTLSPRGSGQRCGNIHHVVRSVLKMVTHHIVTEFRHYCCRPPKGLV